ncbi:QWRF motif-containing protein 2-like [Hibiscus syriacus]|uniref:QWRF motif-containing protein 2-like n=1 Tax=Hibiscus syriacus TaxID=106335 RepID=UPI0019250844|nr:QWRF motif-containing protein 2-like [Hibiscus syriacus]
MMVAAFSHPSTPSRSPVEEPNTYQEETSTSTTKRHPLKDNGSTVTRKPRGRQVSSRYMSHSPSTSSSSSSSSSAATTMSAKTTAAWSKTTARYPSPLISRSTNVTSTSATLPSVPKRSQSVDRRRPGGQVSHGNNANATELSDASNMLITSTRSLSVSFQDEAFSLPISKTKAQVGPCSTRKVTPERRRATRVRDHGDNSKPMDQLRWPGRIRQGNPVSGSNSLSISLDSSCERRMAGSGAMLAKSSQQSIMLDDSSRRASFDGSSRFSLDLGSAAEFLKEPNKQNPDANSINDATFFPCDLTASDTDSLSSGSTNSGKQDYGGSGISKGRIVPRNIAVSAKCWQETSSWLRRLQDPSLPLSTSPGSRIGASAKFTQSKSFSSDCAVSSPPTMASTIRGGTRPASPSKLWISSASSPLRGLSPARVRNAVGGHMIGNSVNSPSIISFFADIRRGKLGDDRIVDAHMLRLLYNRYLQWRFANAREDATFMVQKLSAKKNLWNAWVTTSEMRHSVTLKRIKLLLLRQKLKLTSILKGQIAYLEEWAILDRHHSSALLGQTEALKASVLRLPVIGKAIADIQNLKDAVSSAVDVMQAMASSICLLSSKVEELNSLADELGTVTAKERVLLEQSKDFLSALAAIQAKDCSLRTHMIQLNRDTYNTTKSCIGSQQPDNSCRTDPT